MVLRWWLANTKIQFLHFNKAAQEKEQKWVESKGEPFITTAVFHSYLITIPQSHKKTRTEEPVNPQDVWSGTAVRIHVCERDPSFTAPNGLLLIFFFCRLEASLMMTSCEPRAESKHDKSVHFLALRHKGTSRCTNDFPSAKIDVLNFFFLPWQYKVTTSVKLHGEQVKVDHASFRRYGLWHYILFY